MTVIKIGGIHCQSCVSRIEKALKEARINGEISLKQKTATIASDFDIDKAKQIIEDLGFDIL